MALMRRSSTYTRRCGQPAQNAGGRGGRPSAAGEVRGLGHAKGGADVRRRDLAGARQAACGRLGDVDAHGADAHLQVGVGLLHHVDLVDQRGKRGELLGRQRPGDAQLEHGGVGQGLAHVHVEGAGADDAHLGVAHLHAVERGLLGPGHQLVLAVVADQRAAHGVGGHHHELLGTALVGARLHIGARADHVHQRLGVGDAHGLVQHDHGVKLLGDVEGLLGHLVGLLAVGRVQARDAPKGGVVAAVLLVLRAVAAGVVGGEQHQARVDAGVGRAHEGVGGHVDAHVLHGDEAAHATHGGAQAHLEGDLLVGRPLAVHVGLAHQVLERLGRRGARIGRTHGNAGLPRPLRDGLVAR